MDLTVFLICILFLFVAFLYSSVGHGGASGYLAVLSIFAFAPVQMASTALLLNVIVAGIAFTVYYREGYFSPALTLPFIISSIPLAFLGGLVNLGNKAYTVLLALALFLAAIRLLVNWGASGTGQVRIPSRTIALTSGGLIGFISGAVGVGGGIFLSPLILLMGWADPKHTSATSAMFVILNSVAGIVGRASHGTFSVGTFMPFLVTAIIGGFAGSWWGSKKFSHLTLRRLLALVLLVAVYKLAALLF